MRSPAERDEQTIEIVGMLIPVVAVAALGLSLAVETIGWGGGALVIAVVIAVASLHVLRRRTD